MEERLYRRLSNSLNGLYGESKIQLSFEDVMEYLRNREQMLSAMVFRRDEIAFELMDEVKNGKAAKFLDSEYLDESKEYRCSLDSYLKRKTTPKLFDGDGNASMDFITFANMHSVNIDSLSDTKVVLRDTVYDKKDRYREYGGGWVRRCFFRFEVDAKSDFFRNLVEKYIKPFILDDITKKAIAEFEEEEYQRTLERVKGILKEKRNYIPNT